MAATSRTGRLMLAAVLATSVIGAGVGLGQANADQDIVGGQRASIADHSYVVYLATPDGFQFCGGTLIAGDKVVTAAHCTVGQQPADMTVVAGREDKESDDGVAVKVTEIWVHPSYTDVRAGADISVLTLEQPVDYAPLALPEAGQTDLYAAGRPGLILGWGRTAASGQASRYLLKAEVPLVTDADCTQSYSTYLPEAMVCAGYPEGGVDSCQGDSGGPLVVDGKLAGITSWGEGCAAPGKPGVYTRVVTYLDQLGGQI